MATSPMPYTFGTATAAIPLSQLDTNFATPITLGNTSVYLNNTYSSIGNLTLANVTITSGTVAITNVSVTTANVSGTANISTLVVTANASVAGNVAVTGNVVVTGNVTSATHILTGGTANGVVYLDTTKALTTGSALVFDGSNLGVGVTPSAWNNIFKAVQINAQGCLMATSATMQMGNNIFYDGAYKFIGTGYASRYYQATGQHVWAVSTASGTAGGAITETQAMTLNASGNLGVGTTSPAQRLHVAGGQVQFNNGSDLYINSGASDVGFYSTGNIPMIFYTNSTERARITSGGVMLVGAGATSQLINESSFGATSAANTATFKTTDGNSQPLLVWNSGTGSSRPLITFFYGTTYTSLGGITTNGSVITYGGTSDYRLKNVTGNLSGYKERILAIQPKQGTWKADNAEFRGFLAHEFAEHYPSSVTGEKDAVDSEGNPKYQGMQASSAEVIADLVALIQEQQFLITQLTARITALEGA